MDRKLEISLIDHIRNDEIRRSRITNLKNNSLTKGTMDRSPNKAGLI